MAGIVFIEEQHGILTIPGEIEIDWVLAPEVILDFNLDTQRCDLVKGTLLDIQPITDANFNQLISQLAHEESDVHVDFPRNIFGQATQIPRMAQRLREDDLHEIPYNFSFNLFGESNRNLRQLVGANQWMENEGIFPITNPLWDSISTPEFSVVGVGAREPLSHERHQLGLVHCVLKGRQIMTIIPKGETTTRMLADLKENLYESSRFPRETLQCDSFLQHSKLYYNENFLCENYDAKTVELTAGQFVIVQSGVYFQLRTCEPGVTVSFSCVPMNWLSIVNVGECEHIIGTLTMTELNDVREKAINMKNHTARTLLLNANGPTRAVINVTQRNYPQRVATIHHVLGENPPQPTQLPPSQDKVSSPSTNST